MANVRVFPHRIADGSSVNWGTWWLRLNGERRPAEELVNGWDYSTPLAFEIQPSVEDHGFLKSTGVEQLADCEMVAIAECPSTGHRFVSRRSLAELASGSEQLLVVEPPLGTIAQGVVLSQQIVLSRSVTPSADDIAWQRGARLAIGPRQRVTLEGSAARFPTEAVPFSSLRFPEALWTLRSNWTDPEEALTSVVRLFINTEHPRSDALLEAGHPEHALLHSALEVDIVRQMLVGAQVDPTQFRDPQRGWPDGSAGATLENLTQLFFGKPVHEMLTLQRTDPPAFEMLLQARMNMFGGTG